MRINKLIYAVFAITLIACSSDDSDSNPLFVGDDCLRGIGPVTTELRDLGNFTGVQNSIPANVQITQGPVEDVRIDAPANILEEIITTVDNNTLNIRINECIEDLDNVNIFVTIPEIERLLLTGVGNMNTTESIEVEDLEITLTGVGNFSLKGRAEMLNITLIGVGDVNAFQFETNICNINISGVGDTEVFVNDELDVTITGNGSVFYLGTPTVNSTITGTGTVIDAN